MHNGQSGVYVMGDIVAARMPSDPKRPITIFGGVISSTKEYVPFKAQALVGWTDRVLPAEGVFELNYGIAAYRSVRINLNVQYIVSPDNFLIPRAAKRSGNLLAFGLRASFDAAALFGIPTPR